MKYQINIKRFIRPTAKTQWLPPGSLEPKPEEAVQPVTMHMFLYDENSFEEKELQSLEEFFATPIDGKVVWLNINGIHDTGLLQQLGDRYDIHPLVLEDITHTYQRPKLDDYEDFLYLVLKMITYDDITREIYTEQVSIVLLKGLVISFQEREGDVFDPIRERIRTGRGRLRKMGADYLAYALMDIIVDTYFSILEQIGLRMEPIEKTLMSQPTEKTMHEIHHMKREIIYLFNTLWPLRQLVTSLQQNESKLINKSTRFFLRDIYDHIMQVVDTIQSLRDVVSGMMDMYMSIVNNKMNEVMKVLTVIATIFIPLTFIAGIYGMNFTYMPELQWKYGYFAVLGVMFCIFIGMLVYFKRQRWL